MNLSHRVLAVIWAVGFWLYMPGHTWWNGLWPPEHSHPDPSQVPGTDNQGEPAPGDVWPWCFWGGLLAAWLWRLWTLPKVLFHLGSHVRPEEPITHEVQACTPGPNDQPYHGILVEQPPFVQLAEPTGGSPLILCARLICTGHPLWAANYCAPTGTDWLWGVCCLGLAFP